MASSDRTRSFREALGSSTPLGPRGTWPSSGTGGLFGSIFAAQDSGDGTQELLNLIGAFLNDGISASIIFGETERVDESGDEDGGDGRIDLAEFGNEFDTSHLRHLEIGDDKIDWRGGKDLQCVGGIAAYKQLVTELFENGSSCEQPMAVVIDEKDFRGEFGAFVTGCH
jgi:hypothetical protein